MVVVDVGVDVVVILVVVGCCCYCCCSCVFIVVMSNDVVQQHQNASKNCTRSQCWHSLKLIAKLQATLARLTADHKPSTNLHGNSRQTTPTITTTTTTAITAIAARLPLLPLLPLHTQAMFIVPHLMVSLVMLVSCCWGLRLFDKV